jgi:hypothetical protein
MQRSILLPFAALLLALPGLRAAPPDTAPAVEYIREPKHGEVIHIRNLAALRPAEARLPERVAQGLPAVSPYALMEAPAAPRDPALVAQEFLAAHAPAFGINGSDLEVVNRTPDQIGMARVSFRQLYQGVPVYGVEVLAHVGRNNQVTSVHGRPARVTDVATLPMLTQEHAQLIALAVWQAEHGQKEPAPTKVYGLYVFAPAALGLPEGTNSTPALVWAVDVVPDDCQREILAIRFLMDAESGAIRHEIELHAGDQQLYRKVYDCSLYPVDGGCWSNHETNVNGVVYTFGRREGMPPRGPNPLPAFLGALDVDELYDRLGDVDRYYWEKFGRDGANFQGGVKRSPATETWGDTFVEANSANAAACPNAAFFSASGNLRFCRGTVTLDVVGHEYVHAVNFYSHFAQGGMVSTGESRALDESQADFFGEMLERFMYGGTDWFFASDSALWGRNLADPASQALKPRYGLPGNPPDRYYSTSFTCDWGDWDPSPTAPYINMSVMNKAAYLLTEGGTFNGCTIAGVGAAKAEQILYRASTLHYAVNETFNMAYQSILAACAELYSPADCDQVRRALQSVEIDQAGQCSGLPAHPPAALDPVGW